MELTTPIVVIEGPLGVGKSTLISNSKHNIKKDGYICHFVPEPVEMWRNWHGVDVLQQSIDGERPFFFQTLVFTGFLESLLSVEAKEADVILIERSPDSAFNVFVNNMKDNDRINTQEYMLFQKFLKLFPKPTKIIGLWSHDFDAIYKRILNRDGEINASWVKSVYDQYKNYFDLLKNDPVYVEVDCLKTQKEVTDNVSQIIKHVLK